MNVEPLCPLQVLTVNHVLEIMLRFAECGSWPEAVEKVVPGRKRAAPDSNDAEDDASTQPAASKQPKQEDPSSVPGDADAGITDEC